MVAQTALSFPDRAVYHIPGMSSLFACLPACLSVLSCFRKGIPLVWCVIDRTSCLAFCRGSGICMYVFPGREPTCGCFPTFRHNNKRLGQVEICCGTTIQSAIPCGCVFFRVYLRCLWSPILMLLW
ncbi:unnamed protein product [Laminaria digitata]